MDEVFINQEADPYVLEVDGTLDLAGLQLQPSSIVINSKKGLVDVQTSKTKRIFADIQQKVLHDTTAGSMANPLHISGAPVAGATGLSEEQLLRLDTLFGYVERQVKQKSVSLSKVGSVVWNEIQENARLTVIPYSGRMVVIELEKPPPFGWDDRLERTQADRYMPHMSTYLPMSTRDYQLVDIANHHPTMLSVKSLAKQLGYEFSGTTDVAIVLRQAARIDQPANGLRIVFELKKKASRDDHYQALITLLLSNQLSGCLKPIVIVTDLNEHYCFYWLDDHTIFYHIVDSSSMALGIIKGCLHQEQVTAISEVQPVQGILDVALPMIKRQRINLGRESDNFADEEVDSGLIGAHPMAPMLKRFLDNECPHVQCLTTDPPEHMFV